MADLVLGAGGAAAEAYTIDQSLRFSSADSSYMDSAGGVGTGSRTTWTWSAWVKRVFYTEDPCIFSGYRDGSNLDTLVIKGRTDGTQFSVYVGSTKGLQKTSGVQRDPASWYHYVCTWDTTNGTAADRMRLYINGERVSLATDTQPSEDEVSNVGLSGTVMNIGQQGDGTQNGDFYLADAIFIDGTAYSASDFGETNSDTNQWVPTDPSGLTFGTNGFWFKFEDSGDLGNDSSGNNNDYAVNAIYASYQVPDSPTNNFAILNSLYTNSQSPFNMEIGNLVWNQTSSAHTPSASTIAVNSGKWYFECKAVSGDSGKWWYGMADADSTYQVASGVNLDWGDFASGTFGGDNIALYYNDVKKNGSVVQDECFGTDISNGDICMLAVDCDNGKVWFGKNSIWNNGDPQDGATGGRQSTTLNTSYEDATFDSTKTYYIGVGAEDTKWFVNFGQDSSFAGTSTEQNNQDGNDIGDFYYAVPANHLTLCTSNLPEPSIALPPDHFSADIYTGTAAAKTITTGFQTDFVWGKNRNGTSSYCLMDIVRGTDSTLKCNTTAAEEIASDVITSFNSNGFTLGDSATGPNLNQNGSDTFVTWAWKGGGTGATNDDGSITSTVSANASAGFSVVGYVGDSSSNQTVGHGLAEAPELIIVKNYTDVVFWPAGTVLGSGWGYYLNFDSSEPQQVGGYFTGDGGADPTATVFGVSTNNAVNGNTNEHIAYCFHSVEGYSKVGVYGGNGSGSADSNPWWPEGPFVYTGFTPEFLIIKQLSTVNEGWSAWDGARETYNTVDLQLATDGNRAEYSANSLTFSVDFLSNGFKVNTAYSSMNKDGKIYLYYAVAKSPFKTSNGR